MKHRLKGLLALVLSLVMVLGMVTVSTASQSSGGGSASTTYPVKIGGVELTSDNISSYAGISFTPTDGTNPATLTLNDFTYNGTEIGISADVDLIIKLIGENNTITTTSDKGVSVSGNLIIEGSNGKVTATGVKYGIYADTVTITGGSVLTNSTNDDGWGIYGGGNVTIKDGAKVVAKAGDNGIGIGTIYSTASASSANTIVISGEGTEVEAGCKTGLSAFTVNILENSTVTITTNATAPAVGKAIDATTLNFGSNWYQWSTNNPGETTPISSETKAFALNNYGGTGQNPAPTSLTIGKITYTVTFDANGHGTAPTAQTVASGATASEPTAPTADGWTFGGWYKEAGCSNAFDFNTAITGNITLYAKWTENSGGVPGNQQPSYNYPIYIPTVEDEPEVTTPNTFDGGIASAVVVTILSATGGAWLAKKKD